MNRAHRSKTRHRRRLTAIAFVSFTLALAVVTPRHADAQPANNRATTPIEHYVVLLQQSHTFDNYFGTYPGADGIPPDTCIPVDPPAPDPATCIKPYHIGDSRIDDLNHSNSTFRDQYNNGRMDGFVAAVNRKNQDGRIPLGYYDERELPYYWNLADEYVLFDRYFSSARGGNLWNRMYWIAGVPGNTKNGIPPEGLNDIMTIFDRLQERGIAWKVYIQNYDPRVNYHTAGSLTPLAPQVQWLPLLAMDRFIEDPALSSRIVDLDEYFIDLRNGTLPAVSYVLALGATERPLTSLQLGQQTVRHMLQALMQSDAWPSSAFLLSYDNWGGWYDHVMPPEVDEMGYGFRVPALLISPYAKRGYIDSTVLDHTATLRFIGYNWDIEPLAERDAAANTFLSAFDFSQPPRQPKFISFERETVVSQAEPRRFVIFAFYGAGLALAGALITWAALGIEVTFRRRSRPDDRAQEDACV
jgi:phospholipase C